MTINSAYRHQTISAEKLAVPQIESWQTQPHLQWSMQHMSSILPVHQISRGQKATTFPIRPVGVGDLLVKHPWEGRLETFNQVMARSQTDGWMITHHGQIVAEHYFGSFHPPVAHLLMSVSKSLTATVAGQLITDGTLDPMAPVTFYVPELTGSGYNGARVWHLIDMRTGVKFSEEYLNEDAEVRLLEQAIGWAPHTHKDVPDTLLGFLGTLQQMAPHGGAFDYKSCETDVLGFVIERAAEEHAAEVMSRLLWQPMGAEFNAHVGVDRADSGMFDGGVSATLRDLARFGNLYVNEGRSLNGAQVLPTKWVADTFKGEVDSRDAFARAHVPTLMPGGMYHNGFWFPTDSSDMMLALGIHGQMIYINRATGVVGVKLSTWPLPQDAEKLFWTFRAFDTVSTYLALG